MPRFWDCGAYLDKQLIIGQMISGGTFYQALKKFEKTIKETCEEEGYDISRVKKWIDAVY